MTSPPCVIRFRCRPAARSFRVEMMNNYAILFEKLEELSKEEPTELQPEAAIRELDEIEELRRFSADLQEPEPCSFTTT